MDDYNSETDSDYTSYWRDWVGEISNQTLFSSLLFPTFNIPCFAPPMLVNWDLFKP